VNPEEYEALEQVERDHWFYAGKREIVLWWLRRLGKLQPDLLLVDCGAGTARFTQEAAAYCNVLAVDDHQESLVIARRRLRADQVKEGSCTDLPLPDQSADVVTALDVIEHVPDDKLAVQEMTRILKPGGILVVTVPAFQSLWSDWDVALHHQRRYRHSTLLPLFEKAGLELIHWNYVNVLAFPAVFAIRKLRGIRRNSNGVTQDRAEERIPSPSLNRLLQSAFVRPACQSRIRFPVGVGMLAIGRRPRVVPQ
jgi:SAM-dependent methyltransferase